MIRLDQERTCHALEMLSRYMTNSHIFTGRLYFLILIRVFFVSISKADLSILLAFNIGI